MDIHRRTIVVLPWSVDCIGRSFGLFCGFGLSVAFAKALASFSVVVPGTTFWVSLMVKLVQDHHLTTKLAVKFALERHLWRKLTVQLALEQRF